MANSHSNNFEESKKLNVCRANLEPNSNVVASTDKYDFEQFILFWNKIQDNSFSNTNLKNLFRRYLIEKPYDRYIGQRLVMQLKMAKAHLNSNELEDFFKNLCEDIEKGSVYLKKFIKNETEDCSSERLPETHFVEMLDNNCLPDKEVKQADYSFMYKIRSKNPLSLDEIREINHPTLTSHANTTDHAWVYQDAEIASNYYDLSVKNFFKEKDYKLAEHHSRKAISLFGEAKTITAIAAKNILCIALIRLGRLDEALIVYKEIENCLTYLTQSERDDWADSMLKTTLEDLATNYFILGSKSIHVDKNYKLAEENCRKAIALFGEKKTQHAIGAKINLGLALTKLERYGDALLVYKEVEKSLENFTQSEKNRCAWHDASLKLTHQELAFIYLMLSFDNIEDKDYKLTEQHSRIAIAFFDDTNTDSVIAAKFNLATALTQLGRLDETLIVYKEIENCLKCLTQSERNQWNSARHDAGLKRSLQRLATIYSNLSMKNFNDKDYKSAELNCRKAIELFGGAKTQEAITAKINLGQDLTQLGKLEEALVIYKEVEKCLDSLTQSEKSQLDWASLDAVLRTRLQELAPRQKLEEYSQFNDIEYHFNDIFKDYKKNKSVNSPRLKATKEITHFISELKNNPPYNSRFVLIGYILFKQNQHKKSNSIKFWKKESEFSQLISKLFSSSTFIADQSCFSKAKELYEAYAAIPRVKSEFSPNSRSPN